MNLRHYQLSIFNQVIESNTNDIVQLDTGAGKTPIIAKLAEHYKQAAIVCHRNILIKQASEKLALCGLEHCIIGANSTKKLCARNNTVKAGRHYINPAATICLISIDTINSRIKRGGKGLDANTEIILIDEAHHLAEDNKWYNLANQLNVRCVGFTATPCRSDGQPMLKQYGGFFDKIIQAEGYKENGTERLIAEGYLAQYRCIYYEHRYHHEHRYQAEERGAPLLDVVDKYCKTKQTIIIEPRINNAIATIQELIENDYSAAVLHSKLSQHDIDNVLNCFEKKFTQILVAVDMINEGFDVPDADVLIINRKVNSLVLYRQLCGRVLRPRAGKRAVIIDVNGHAVSRYGLPSDAIDWDKRQEQIRRRDLTVCVNCHSFFKATLQHCPFCNEFNDLSQRCKWLGYDIHTRLFTAKEVERKRKAIAAYKQQKLIEAQQKKEEELARNIYFEFTAKFDDSLIGKRCTQLYQMLQTELKHQLQPAEYNKFFKRNEHLSFDTRFYVKELPRNFEKNLKAAALKVYEVHK